MSFFYGPQIAPHCVTKEGTYMVKDLLLPATYKFVVLGTMVTQIVFEEYAAFSWANACRIYLYRMMTAQFVIPYSFRACFYFPDSTSFLSLKSRAAPDTKQFWTSASGLFSISCEAERLGLVPSLNRFIGWTCDMCDPMVLSCLYMYVCIFIDRIWRFTQTMNSQQKDSKDAVPPREFIDK